MAAAIVVAGGMDRLLIVERIFAPPADSLRFHSGTWGPIHFGSPESSTS